MWRFNNTRYTNCMDIQRRIFGNICDHKLLDIITIWQNQFWENSPKINAHPVGKILLKVSKTRIKQRLFGLCSIVISLTLNSFFPAGMWDNLFKVSKIRLNTGHSVFVLTKIFWPWTGFCSYHITLWIDNNGKKWSQNENSLYLYFRSVYKLTFDFSFSVFKNIKRSQPAKTFSKSA